MINYCGETLKRINKTLAWRLYDAGYDVYACPCKMNPESHFWPVGVWGNKKKGGDFRDFITFWNCFTYYNCNNETGYYLSYYIKKDIQA